MRVLKCGLTVFLILLASVSFAVDVPDVKLSVLSTPSSVIPGGSFTVQVQAVNNGVGVAKLARIYPQISEPFSLKEGTDAEARVDYFGYGRPLVASFSFTVSPDALADIYNVTIFAEYADQNNNTGRVSQGVPINVVGTPLLEVMDIAMPENIAPGDTAAMNVSIRNIGAVNARKVRVVFANMTDPSVKPYGNPVAYVDDIPAGSEKVFQLSFAVDGKAPAKSYLLPITVAYQDNAGKDYSSSRLASAGVESQIMLDAFSSNQNPLVSGTQGTIGVTVANIGQHDAEFLMLEVLDNGVYPKDTYIGTLESNDYSTADLKLTPEGSGEKQLHVRLTYRDQYNRESVLERNIGYSVISPAEFAKEQPQSATSYLIPAVVVLVILYLVYRRFRK